MVIIQLRSLDQPPLNALLSVTTGATLRIAFGHNRYHRVAGVPRRHGCELPSGLDLARLCVNSPEAVPYLENVSEEYGDHL